MDYDTYFREHLEALHLEGRYRVFADLKRRCGAYPAADQFTGHGTRDVTVWCSNERVQTLKGHLAGAGLPVMENPSHIVPVMVGDPVHCKAVTDTLLDHYRIYVQPINYPTVPRGTERMRLTPSPMHTDAQIGYLLRALQELWARCPVANGQYVRLAAE